MTYFPSGFWSRLITRILADDSIVEIVRSFFIMPKEVRLSNGFCLGFERTRFALLVCAIARKFCDCQWVIGELVAQMCRAVLLQVLQNSQLLKLLDVTVEWVLWQTGIELRYADIVIFRIKEVLPNVKTFPINYREQRCAFFIYLFIRSFIRVSLAKILAPVDPITYNHAICRRSAFWRIKQGLI